MINLQNVSPGTKDVAIQVSGPSNISIEPKQKSAKVTIVKKENPDKEVQGNGEQPNSNNNQDNQDNQTEKPKILNQNLILILIRKRRRNRNKIKIKKLAKSQQ